MEKTGVVPKKFGKLKWAIYRGRREMVESLLEENTPVDNVCTPEKDFRSPLHSSVYLGDLDIVKKLLDRGAALDVLNENNETALMLAAKFEKYDIVDILLSNERLRNCANRENFTHLHIACMRNRVDVVQKLLEHPSEANTAVKPDAIRWSGFTPLHFAVHFKSIGTISFLLSLGADITIRDTRKLTALHLADMTRNVQMIDMILSAHKRVAKNPVNSEGLSHFHIACTRNNKEVIEFFIRNGVNIGEKVYQKSSNWPGFTALDFAIYYDCPDVVKLLLQEGNRDIFPSKNGHDRIEDIYFTGNEELVHFILYRDRLKKEKVKQIEKPPLLHTSCIRGDIEDVRGSLSKTPNKLNSVTWQGNTPLHLAVERGNKTIIEYLLDQGADLNIKNAYGKSPLHLAFERNMKEIVNSFFSCLDFIKHNPTDDHGLSHFHIACIYDQVEAVEHFINLGMDIDAPVDFDSIFWPGFTPLHFAAKFGSIRVAAILLKHGASYSTIDKHGLSAFDVAMPSRKISQKNTDDRFEIMRKILESHLKYKRDSFNDRGYSLLHLNFCHDEFSGKKKFIKDHLHQINQKTHKLSTPWDGYTPLHFALSESDTEFAILLIKMGADPSIKSANGNYPYHLITNDINGPIISKSTKNLDKLLHNPVGSNGLSLFHVACATGHAEWVKYFLDHGIDPNAQTTLNGHEFYDKTPLQLAVSSQSSAGSKLEVVKHLIKHGANVKLKDTHLNTPLHHIIGYNEPEIVDIFVKLGVDVDSRNACLETPLFMMCTNYFMFLDEYLSDILERFLDQGANVNLEDEFGTTILTVDTWRDNLEYYSSTIEVLLKHLKKLEAAGLYISEENFNAQRDLSLHFAITQGAAFLDELCQYSDECRKELEVLKQVRLSGYTTLQEILSKDLHELSVISENDEFRRIASSDDLRKKYPIYGPMIELQLRKGQDRRQLVTDAGKASKFLTKICVPRECTEQILLYLSNEDLNNIIATNL
ncbi:hypothetical protein QAD02_001246 [Eretmocerus hayati]|uniref:Uncharacterized protein n=1 Tax=Eretmocerus hayati TaxID=131215 RepID=A0ACC2NIA8_9HYME|nr:hypothetical protein QAD02_001246 [Eretmocerus hayati]